MKALYILVLFLSLLTWSCGGGSEKKSGETDSTQTASIAPENLQTAEFTVSGMTCEGCENTVCTAVESTGAVAEAKASFSEGKATVSFDKTRTTAEDLKALIEAKGYKVEALALN